MLARKAVLPRDAAAPEAASWGSSADRAHGFAAIDQWLEQRGESALAVAYAADLEACEALAEHAARRLSARCAVARASGGPASEGFRELARSLSSGAESLLTARDVALAIARAIVDAKIGAVVVTDQAASRFSSAVATELEGALSSSADAQSEDAPNAQVLWVVPRASAEASRVGREPGRAWLTFEVEGALAEGDVGRWWEVARAAPLAPQARTTLKDLEAWWRSARAEAGAPRAQPSTSRAARVLALAGRAWPLTMVSELGLSPSEVDELVASGGADVRVREPEPVPWIALRSSNAGGADGGGADAGRADGGVADAGGADAGGADARSGDGALLLAQRDRAERARVTSALVHCFGSDPWALMRAAEISLQGGAVERGDELALGAIERTVDADARSDLWARFWSASPSPSPTAERLLAFVDVALRKGDGEWALRFAREAVAVAPVVRQGGAVLLALGRALAASGDLTAARLTLEKVTEAACDGVAERLVAARACVELAEARYYSSDLAGARSSADDALGRLRSLLDAGSEAAEGDADRRSRRAAAIVRLDARNVLGKLLLAQADYPAAEEHFAGDAFEASLVEQPVSELRARVNRAIAVMSLGRRAEAQHLLESVLSEAEAAGELKAIGICLINLAALAIIDRRYGEALELSERAVEVLRRIGDKVALSRCVANLAELRVRVGLLEEAAQAVRFGTRVLSGGLPPEQASRFALTLARVSLAKGDSGSAQRHVTQALAALGATLCLDLSAEPQSVDAKGGLSAKGPVADHVGEALRLAARIALEDGDTIRARVLIERAAAERVPARARAELSVLRALLARAAGEPFESRATEALRAARDADDDELAREAHVLLFRAALDDDAAEGGGERARHHLHAAIAIRDRVADGIPAQLRERFLARRDLASLEREARGFEASLTQGALATLGDPSSYPLSSPRFAAPSQVSHDKVPSLASSGARRIVGDDPGVKALLNAIRKVGPADATVLIHGESGTGKELVAEALHEASSRRAGPLVKVNCAALVETLLLSELFGHEKGAFTGAAGRRRGRFEAADNGTLFLDEIGDISPRTQVALLRVLQEKTFERVGGTSPIRANVRVVCATHRNLKALVARGEFREDLYYRLAGVTLEVPALRSRLSDVGALSDAILRRIAEERGGSVKRLSPLALSALRSHTWPGNIRELENGLRAASLFAEGDTLEASDFAENVESLRHIAEVVEAAGASLPPTSAPVTMPTGSSSVFPPPRSSVRSYPPSSAGAEGAPSEPMRSRPSIDAPSAPAGPASAPEVAYAHVRSGVSLHDMKRLIERECIVRALGEAGGNITKAATLLGMKRPRLSQLVKQYGLGGADASDDVDAAANEEEE
jgi:transcriptional regulator with GAF, ATPase, and Fis domain/tetratricopeptide (TPR) repeat protein